MSLTLTVAYIVYLTAVTAIAVILLIKTSWRTAVAVTLIIAKLWLAVYSVIGIDVPVLSLYSRRTWKPVAVITFNEIQLLTLLVTNILLNREYIARIIRAGRL